MERGLIVEAEAADWYEFDQDVTTQRVGFITDDDHTTGCSPDRLVGGDGLLEIKAPLPHTQVEYWISGKLNERFWPQLQGQLYITQRSWVDILCWHDVLPKLVMRVEPDAAFIKALDHELQIFNYFVEGGGKNPRHASIANAAGRIGAAGRAARQPRNHSVICPAFPLLRGASSFRDGHDHDFAIKQRTQHQQLEWP
jgi:hypothetical protein